MIEIFGIGTEHFPLRKVNRPGGKIALAGRESQSGRHGSEAVEFPVHSLDISFQNRGCTVRRREVTHQAGPPAYVVWVHDPALPLQTVVEGRPFMWSQNVEIGGRDLVLS